MEARLARLLENSVQGRIPRQRWAMHVKIASRLGTGPDAASRTLRKLAERGLIELSRQEIHLLDQEKLELIPSS